MYLMKIEYIVSDVLTLIYFPHSHNRCTSHILTIDAFRCYKIKESECPLKHQLPLRP